MTNLPKERNPETVSSSNVRKCKLLIFNIKLLVVLTGEVLQKTLDDNYILKSYPNHRSSERRSLRLRKENFTVIESTSLWTPPSHYPSLDIPNLHSLTNDQITGTCSKKERLDAKGIDILPLLQIVKYPTTLLFYFILLYYVDFYEIDKYINEFS